MDTFAAVTIVDVAIIAFFGAKLYTVATLCAHSGTPRGFGGLIVRSRSRNTAALPSVFNFTYG
jgi:hypothetical protein